jgi:hypothetical protein
MANRVRPAVPVVAHMTDVTFPLVARGVKSYLLLVFKVLTRLRLIDWASHCSELKETGRIIDLSLILLGISQLSNVWTSPHPTIKLIHSVAVVLLCVF